MRHIEKLKKIFTCCGKECSADTNGQALDQLVTLAENGELGGGGGSRIEREFEVSINEGVKEFDCSNYTFVTLHVSTQGNPETGLYIFTDNPLDYEVECKYGGGFCGTLKWDGTKKKIFFTPNTDFFISTVLFSLVFVK